MCVTGGGGATTRGMPSTRATSASAPARARKVNVLFMAGLLTEMQQALLGRTTRQKGLKRAPRAPRLSHPSGSAARVPAQKYGELLSPNVERYSAGSSAFS